VVTLNLISEIITYRDFSSATITPTGLLNQSESGLLQGLCRRFDRSALPMASLCIIFNHTRIIFSFNTCGSQIRRPRRKRGGSSNFHTKPPEALNVTTAPEYRNAVLYRGLQEYPYSIRSLSLRFLQPNADRMDRIQGWSGVSGRYDRSIFSFFLSRARILQFQG